MRRAGTVGSSPAQADKRVGGAHINMTNHTPDVPHKQCAKCDKMLPATTQYFGRCSACRDGLRSSCKPCEAAAEKLRQANDPYNQAQAEAKRQREEEEARNAPLRRCKRCGQEFPLTAQFFHRGKGSAGGFIPECKPCALKSSKERFDKLVQSDKEQGRSFPATKQCTTCKQSFPRTIKYFANQANSRDGFQPTCRDCADERERKRTDKKDRAAERVQARKQRKEERKRAAIAAGVPMRQCSVCDQEFPLTADYFQPGEDSRDGFEPRCRKCSTGRAIELRKTFAQRKAEAQAKRDAGLRKCRVCQHWKPADLDHFSARSSNSTGLNSMCKECAVHSNAKTRDQRRADPVKREIDRIRSNKAGKEWNKRNREKVRQRARAYQQANKEKMRILTRRRQARKKSLPDTLTEKEWQFALDYFGGCCAYCGKPAGLFDVLCVEHYVPISSPDCKGTTADNCLPACHGGIKSCNNLKHDKDPETWILSHFGKREGRKIIKRIADYFATVRSAKGQT